VAEKNVAYGVYQKKTGSYRSGDLKFVPGAVVETPSETAKKLSARPDVPVRFLGSAEKAAAEVAELQKKFTAPAKK
jgi:hypothetical protein